MTARLVVVALVVPLVMPIVMVLACTSGEARDPAAGGAEEPDVAADPESPATPASVPAGAAPPAEAPTCNGFRAEVAALVATPPAKCETDADCGCYPAVIDCGGVSTAANAAAIHEVAARFMEAACPYEANGAAFNCAPWQCVAVCGDGMCRRG